MKNQFKISEKSIFILLILNCLARLIITLTTTLGNDEVYYVQYALNPAISHFDHPPLVGFLIRLSSFNLAFIYEDFFVRFGALLIGTINLYIIYRIGILLKNKRTGLIAALVYSCSLYTSIIVGTFILPDTPMSLFWLLSIWTFIKFLGGDKKSNLWLLCFGIMVGLGLASKYQAIFLWFGAFIFLVFFKPKTFLSPYLWLSGLCSILIFSPVLYWSFTSEYSGINYHSERVGNGSWLPSLNYFFPEFFGQFFYNNPFNVILIILALIQVFKQKITALDKRIVFLLCISLPLIITTLGISLYSRTLPHWSGPSYFALILIVGFYATSSEYLPKRSTNWILKGSLFFFFLTIVLGLFQIKTGTFALSKSDKPENVGQYDFTVDLGMWEQIATELNTKIEGSNSNASPYLITHNWFPAGHLDYYYALPHNKKLYVVGDYKKKHEYLRLNKKRGGLPINANAFYITTSNYYEAPSTQLLQKFESFEKEVIPVTLNEKTIVNLFVWELKNLKKATTKL